MNKSLTNNNIVVIYQKENKENDRPTTSDQGLHFPHRMSHLAELEVDPRRIARQLRKFVECVDEEFQKTKSKEVGIDTIEMSFSVNGKGKLAILGSGLECAGNASIKIIIKPKVKKENK